MSGKRKHRLLVPDRFWTDCIERGKAYGKVFGFEPTNRSGIIVEMTDEELDRFEEEARRFASNAGPIGGKEMCLGVYVSAKATVKRIEDYRNGKAKKLSDKERKPRKSLLMKMIKKRANSKM
jgi:hypothetical protein